MLELTTLKIGADTKPLENLIGTLKEVRKALSGLDQPLSNVEKVTESTRKSSKSAAKGADELNQAVDKQEKKLSAVQKTLLKKSDTLRVMRDQEIQAADGAIKLGDAFTRSQSAALATLKIMGATVAELKTLAATFEEMNVIMGVDPFDKSAGHLRTMKKEVEELNYVNRMMNQGINLNKKELQGLSRDIIRVTEAMKAEGTTAADLARAVKRVTDETVALSRAKAIEEQQLKTMEAARAAEARTALDAETLKAETIRKTNAAMKKQADLIEKTNLKVGYMEKGYSVGSSSQAASMKIAGVSDDEIDSFLSRMKQMEEASRAARKAETDRVREARKNAGSYSDSTRKAASAAEWLRLTEERLQAQLTETDRVMRKQYTDTLVKLRQNLNMAGYDANKAEREFKRLEKMIRGVASKENARNLDYLARAVSVQMGDVAISLASGMNPLLVLIQQGDQIRGAIQQSGVAGKQLQDTMFVAARQIASSFMMAGQAIGGFFTGAIVAAGNASANLMARVLGLQKMLVAWEASSEIAAAAGNRFSKALLTLTKTMLGVASVGIGAAMLSFAVGAFQAMRENDKLARSLALTNGALGITHSQAFAAATAYESAGGNAGKFIKVLSEMGKTGELTANQMTMVADAAIALDKFGGVKIEDTVKRFADLQKDPVDALIKLQKETGMVTRALFDQVEALVKVGREYEAGQLAVQEYSRITTEQVKEIKENYTTLGTVMISIGETISDFWDKYVIGLFRKSLTEQQLVVQELDKAITNLESKQSRGTLTGDQAAKLEVLREQKRLLSSSAALERERQEKEREQNLLAQEALQARIKGIGKVEQSYAKIAEYAIKIGKAENAEDKETFYKLMVKEQKELADLLKPKSGKKSQFEKDMEVFNDLLQNAEGNTSRFNNSMEALQRLLDNPAFAVALGKDRDALEAVQKAMRELNEQQPAFKEFQKKREEYLKKVTKATLDYEKATRSLEQAQLDAYVAEQEQLDVLKLSTQLRGLSSIEQEKFNKLIKAGIEYQKELAEIERIYDSNDPRKAEALSAAATVYAKKVEGALTDAHIKSINAYKDYFDEISKGLSDAIVTALFEGGSAGKKKLRDLIVNELRKKITLQIDAFINPIITGGLDMIFGNGVQGASQAFAQGTAFSNLYTNAAAAYNGISAAGGLAGLGSSLYVASGLKYGTGFMSQQSRMLAAQEAGMGTGGFGSFINGAAGVVGGHFLGRAIGGGYSTGGSGNSMINAGALIGALAGPIGSIVGGAIGGTLNRLFGRKAPEATAFGVQGSFTNGSFSGAGFTSMFSEGGTFRKDKRWEDYVALGEGETQLFQSQYEMIRNSVKGMAESLGVGTEEIDRFTFAFKTNFKDLSEADQMKALEEEFKKLSDAMVENIFPVSQYVRYNETATDALIRMSTVLGQTNEMFDLLNWSLYDSSFAGYAAADSFVTLFGGLNEATSALSTYYNEFYTAQEKTTNMTEILAREFTKLGLTIPKTKEEFRSLVETIKATGDSEYLAEVISLSGAFAEVMRVQKDELAPYLEYQKQLLTLQGDINKLRELELQGLDETSQALQKQIWLLEDMQDSQEKFSNSLKELEKNYLDAQAAVQAAEEKVQSIRDQATDRYISATERVASATDRMVDIQESLRQTYADSAKALREYLGQQSDSSSFSQLIEAAKSGDLDAIGKLTSSADKLIERGFSSASTREQAIANKNAVLAQVAEVAGILEGYNGSSLEEQILSTNKDMLEANQELIDANRELADALYVVNEIGATLTRVPQDLVEEFNRAITELANAESFENAMLVALNGVKAATEAIAENTNELSVELKLFAQQVMTDVITTVNVVAVSNLPDDLRALALAGNSVLERTVKFIVEDSALSEDDRKMLLSQTQAVTKTFQLIADSTGLTDNEKSVLLNATSSASRLVEINATLSDSLTDEQRAILAASNLVVTKTVKQVVESGVLTDDQRSLLTTINETVTRITDLGIDDSGLTDEQKALFNLLSEANGSANLNVGGSVTWTFDDIIREVLERIAQATEATAEDIKRIPTTPPGGATTFGAGGDTSGGGRSSPGTDTGPYVPVVPFASGGVFTNGIVSRPTNFAIGQMGESGSEAIMPLTKTSNGSLGVTMVGSNRDLLEELKLLNERITSLEYAAVSTAQTNSRIAKILERVTPDGESLQVSTST